MSKLFRNSAQLEAQEVAEDGTFSARLVQLGKVNRNRAMWAKDVTLTSDQVLISTYDHKSLGGLFTDSVDPVGAGKLEVRGNYIHVTGHYNLEVQDGKDAHARMRFMHAHGYRQDWSIAGYVEEYTTEQNKKDGEYEVYQTVMPVEASPVIVGADPSAKLTTVQSRTDEQQPRQSVIWIPGIMQSIRGVRK